MKYEDKKDIRGAGGGGGKGGGGGDFRAPVESPNTLRSRQYAKVIDLVSEGEIGGLVNGARSIFLDDTPLQNDSGTYNFQGLTLVERLGTQGQSYIPGFDAVESEKAVAVEVTAALPVARSISNTDATAVRVTLGMPRMTDQDTTTGDLRGTAVAIAIDVQNNGGGWVAQALRKIYRSNVFSLSGGVAQNTLASSNYIIDVNWTGEAVLAPQTCDVQLQYRAVGDTTWLVGGTHRFSGGTFYRGGTSAFPQLDTPPAYPTGSKTFNLTLAEDEYQFRVVKTNGSRQQAFYALDRWILQAPLVGAAYGGTAAFGTLQAYTPEFSDVISGKTTGKYQRAYRIELPSPGPWDIRVRRLTADSTSSAIVNNTWFDSYTEIVDAKLTYPNSAIYALQIDAKQFNQIPTRSYELNGIKVKVPSNYDPLTREYTGTWDGTFQTAWSDNPAWVFYDIITNDRYGLGELVPESMLDKWGLYTIAQYCDTMVPDGFGGFEPRFTCNLYLQTREAAASIISAMASVFRGIAYWSAGGVQVAQDAPKDVEQLFTPANVIDGMFSYSGSASKTRHTVVLVSWNDPQDGYRQKIEYVEDAEGIARYGVVQTEVLAVGCTSRGQAHRFGRSIIYTELQELEVVSFKAGLDSVYVQPGSIISIQDPTRAGKRFGGRLVSGAVGTVTIDSPVTIESGKTYELSCALPDGTIETVSVTNAPGTTSTLTVSPDFSAAPQDYAIWVLSASDLIPEQWRVLSIAEDEGTQLEINAMSYRPDKYLAIEQNMVLEPLPTSLVNAGEPATPANINVVESLYLAAVSVVGVKATVSWNSVDGVSYYMLTYGRESENQVTVTTDSISVDIQPIEEGFYTFSVQAVNSLGRRSQANTVAVEIYGKSIPPNDVQDLRVAPLGSIGLFTWQPSTDLDVQVGGRVYFRFSANPASTWDQAFDLPQEIAGATNTASLPLQAGVYLAKFEDSSGNLSQNATSVITDAANIIALNFVEALQGHPDWTGIKTDTQYYPELAGLMLRSADLWDSDDLMDSDELMDFGGGVKSSGTYALGQIDLGSVKTSRVISEVNALGIDLLDTWDSEELMDSPELIDGAVVDDVTAQIYVRHTNDDPSGSPSWSAWQTIYLADISARAYEAELRLTSGALMHNVVVTEATLEVDMPDLVQSGDDITSGITTYTVTFPQAFQVVPAIGVTAQDMATGDYYTISNKSVTGFDIDFFDSGAAQISRTFDYIAKAY